MVPVRGLLLVMLSTGGLLLGNFERVTARQVMSQQDNHGAYSQPHSRVLLLMMMISSLHVPHNASCAALHQCSFLFLADIYAAHGPGPAVTCTASPRVLKSFAVGPIPGAMTNRVSVSGGAVLLAGGATGQQRSDRHSSQ